MTAAAIPIVGVGAGGHAKAVADAVLSTGAWEVVGLLDHRPELRGTRVLGIEVLGGDELLPGLLERGVRSAFIGIGGVGDNRPRADLFARLAAAGFELPPIAHRTAVIAPSARLGPGTVALAGVIVNPEAMLGADVILNSGALVEHDCRLGDHCHVGPGARLGGGVTAGELVHVGIGATVRQGIRLGAGCVVAAGAVVVDDVPAGAVVAGVPARPLDA